MKNIKEKLKNIEYNNLYPLFFTIIFILILIQYSFNSLDAIFYDLWVRTDIVSSNNKQVVVITMDEESDQFLGEVYPYTYATHIRFLDKLLNDSPAIVGYMVPFTEPQNSADEENIIKFNRRLQEYQKDRKGIFRIATDKDAWGEQLPPDELIDLGYSLGIINRDGYTFARDDVTRRVILNISGEDSFHLWISNKYRGLKGKDRIEASGFKGSYYDPEADATFSLFRYGSNPNIYEDSLAIPFHRVVVGNFQRGFFKDKIILIGPQYLSNIDDFIFTPFGKEGAKASKMNVHGQIINSLIADKTIFQLPDWITDTVAIFIAIFLSFIISKVQPTKGLLITVTIMMSMFFVAYVSFVGLGVWIKLSHIILSIFVVYYIWVPFRAIGEYQTRYAIQEETKAFKKVDKLKQNFISLMSHDLKTPVAKIAGIADILRVQYDNKPDQRKLLDNIMNATRELNNFITSILDLTKVESRNIQLRLESKDINTLVESTIEKLKYEANEKQMTLSSDLGPLYPIKIDQNLINRVLANLIGNAIKYAGEGKVIKIKTWDDEQWVYIEIADNGVGIKEEDLENIFEKFYRVKNDDSHKIKGSGLGLYLVKYFIELHSGIITASSKENIGTKFLVQLKNE